MSSQPANAGIIEAWNTVLFSKFSKYEHLLVQGFGQHGSRLFECIPPPAGASVLDIGSGFVDSTDRVTRSWPPHWVQSTLDQLSAPGAGPGWYAPAPP